MKLTSDLIRHLRDVVNRNYTWIMVYNEDCFGISADCNSPTSLEVSTARGMTLSVRVPTEGFFRRQRLWIAHAEIASAIADLSLQSRAESLSLSMRNVTDIFLRASHGLINLELES